MEERQTKIREGAGLEESRLNTEFIEWMKKYSTPLLLVLAVAAGTYFLWNYYKTVTERGIDDSFRALDAAMNSRNPTSLVRVAEEETRLTVPLTARLSAADLHLNAARTGVPIGVALDPANPGKLPEGTEALTSAQRDEQVSAADGLYKQVADETAGNPDRVLHFISAQNGLAACAEMKGQFEAARGHYQKVIDAATEARFVEAADQARRMMESIDGLSDSPRLYAEADLPQAAKAVQPFSTGLQDIKFGTKDGGMFKMGEDGKAVPIDPNAPSEEPTPAPAPTPAPTPAPASENPAPAQPH